MISMANIQILSDLHLESPKAYDLFDIVPKAPYLALLGDIGNIIPHKEECLAFLTRQLLHFRAVLFVPGNHEAYGSSWSATLDVLTTFEQDVKQRRSQDKDAHDSDTGLGQFVLLHRGVFELSIDGSNRIMILGCSLFSHIPPEREMTIEMGLQDFYQTTSWDTRAHNEAHGRDLAWLNDQVARLQQEDSGVRIAIFTHWSPTMDARSTDPKHSNSSIVSAFATDLCDQLCFASDKVVLWSFGHTHYNCDFVVERRHAEPLRLVTNQRGYYFAQAQGFDGEKILEL